MDIPVESMSALSKETLIAMLSMFVFFYWLISRKIDKFESRCEDRFNRLESKVTDIDQRLCRLEGAFMNKDCCMIKDDRQMKKAE